MADHEPTCVRTAAVSCDIVLPLDFLAMQPRSSPLGPVGTPACWAPHGCLRWGAPLFQLVLVNGQGAHALEIVACTTPQPFAAMCLLFTALKITLLSYVSPPRLTNGLWVGGAFLAGSGHLPTSGPTSADEAVAWWAEGAALAKRPAVPRSRPAASGTRCPTRLQSEALLVATRCGSSLTTTHISAGKAGVLRGRLKLVVRTLQLRCFAKGLCVARPRSRGSQERRRINRRCQQHRPKLQRGVGGSWGAHGGAHGGGGGLLTAPH